MLKSFLIVIFIFFLTNCSLNKNSNYWTNNQYDQSDKILSFDNNKNLPQIIEKSGDLNSMTIQEYELFIKDYTEKSEFPDISK